MHKAHCLSKRLRNALQARFGPNAHYAFMLPAVLCLALIWPFGGGWNTVNLMAGATSPAAQGVVKYKTSGNDNIKLQIDAQSLAPPSSLMPPENVYVAWIRPPGQSVQNLGQLKVNGKEQAQLDTVTAFKRFHIFITAEQNAQTQQPEGPTILSADVSR